jgi:hypothetical protein
MPPPGFAKVAGPSDMSGKNQAGPIFFSGVPDLMSGTNTGIYPRPIKTEFSPLNKKMKNEF